MALLSALWRSTLSNASLPAVDIRRSQDGWGGCCESEKETSSSSKKRLTVGIVFCVGSKSTSCRQYLSPTFGSNRLRHSAARDMNSHIFVQALGLDCHSLLGERLLPGGDHGRVCLLGGSFLLLSASFCLFPLSSLQVLLISCDKLQLFQC